MHDKDKRDRHGSGVSSKSSSSSSSSSLSLLDPPDGGWGWVVVFASFTAHMIADGCAFSFGVFYVELLDYFQESKAVTALVGSLFVSVPLITGPLASAFTNRYGCRNATIIGGFIAGTSFVISSFSNSIEMLCFTFGIMAGIGLSMVYVAAIVVVAFYFEDKRAFATGIAVAGSGIGTFIFAPLTEFLIEKYTWRGALLIIGGIMFNIMVAGAAFRPLTSPKIERKRKKYLENLGRFSQFTARANLAKEQTPLMDHNGHAKENRENGVRTSSELNDSAFQSLLDEPVTHSLMQFPTFMKEELTPHYADNLHDLGKGGKTLQEVLLQHGLLEKFILHHSASNVDLSTKSNSHFQVNNTEHAEGERVFPQNKPVLSKSENKNGGAEDSILKKEHKLKLLKKQDFSQLLPLYRKDIFYRGSLLKTGSVINGKSASCPNIVMHNNPEEESTSTEDNFAYRLTVMSKEVRNIMHKMMDVSILRSSMFLYFCLSSFLLYFAYDVPYVFTPDKAIQMGISEAKASFLVSIIGITSTVGQILIGWIGDLQGVNSLHLYSVLTSLAGAVTIMVPWLSSYGLLCSFAAAFGILISANYALTTIILVQLVGMDKLTNAYGIVMLFEGLANLFGPPAAGILSDKTGSYDLTFIVFGVIILLSGVMFSAIPCIRKCDKSIYPAATDRSSSSPTGSLNVDDEVNDDSDYTKEKSTGIVTNCISSSSPSSVKKQSQSQNFGKSSKFGQVSVVTENESEL